MRTKRKRAPRRTPTDSSQHKETSGYHLDVDVVRLEERPGRGRLGRHVEHDPRSRQYGVISASVDLKQVLWRRYGSILDQGDLGSCTGNALTGALMTGPLYRNRHNYGERTAVAIYKRATAIDEFDGAYPPDDTGSSGLAVCKAAVERRMIVEYRWAFGIQQALLALQNGPVITGVAWHEGFDHPDQNGRVKLAGEVRGGHEFLVRGYDPDTHTVFCDNSWSKTWGVSGSFVMAVSDWDQLLQQQGDVVQPLR